MAPEDQKPVFSRDAIQKKQAHAKAEYENKVREMRQVLDGVVKTSDGEKFLHYLFLICSGDMGPIRRDKESKLDVSDTLVSLGTQAVWSAVRFNMSTEACLKIERRSWEKEQAQ